MISLIPEGEDELEISDPIDLTEHDVPIDWYSTHGITVSIIREPNEEDICQHRLVKLKYNNT